MLVVDMLVVDMLVVDMLVVFRCLSARFSVGVENV
jgi:hypothetical protein